MGVGAFVQGAVGFGSALVAAPLLWLLNPLFVPAPVIMAACLLTLLVMLREPKNIELRTVGWAALGRVPGTALGVWTLRALPAPLVGQCFAALVLLAVGLLVFEKGPERSRGNMFAAGLVAGVMGTVTSVGGPPIALMFRDATGPVLRSTLSAYFLLSTAMSLSGLWLAGLLSERELTAFVVLVPGTCVGVAASRLAHGYLDRGRTRAALLGVSALGALSVWVRAL